MALLQTPLFFSTDFLLFSAARRAAVVSCEADANEFPIERFVVEFEDDERAENFCRELEREGATIKIEDDHSIEAAPAQLKKSYIALKAAGNKVGLKKLLAELWEDYGIDPENLAPRITSGVKRIAIMHDDGVCAWGFRGMKKELREWMTQHGFPRVA